MPGPQQLTILLAEDSEDDAFLFSRTLAKIGKPNQLLVTVNNGSAAVTYLNRTFAGGDPSAPRPDLIFLDLKMPQLSGFDVLDWISKQTFLPPLRVIVLSGSDEQRDKTLAMESGAAEFITKPISVMDLKRLIESCWQ